MNWNNDTIRKLERDSIEEWVVYAARDGYFTDRTVLDVGCGYAPYREAVEAGGGTWYGLDHPAYPASVVAEPVGSKEYLYQADWGAILCTQVIQYQPDPEKFLYLLYRILVPGGYLVITWPTCWDEIEPEDLWRLTMQGGLELLSRAGFRSMTGHRRAEIPLGGFRFNLGCGAIASK